MMEIIASDYQEPIDNATNLAVYVQSALKSYGIGKRRSNILQSLNMAVEKGSIFGLLGASGCGKTTLLSCIVGRRSLDSGEIYVYGNEPGTKESGIPGRRVGYMPQELALYGEFTIKETLEYFGRLYSLANEYVQSQMEFLFKLLDLPPRHRFIKTLSGGQQRRVSFAVALFHDPELLILDEPTVGLDPLLRQSIWSHLIHLSTVRDRTIIITTHYIEEASQAHKVGMMRSGSLLAEDSPQNLLNKHNLVSLEDVFLKLCMKQQVEDEDSSVVRLATTSTNSNKSSQHQRLAAIKQKEKRGFQFHAPSPHRTLVLLHKNFLHIFRNIGILLFLLALPVVQMVIFCHAIGHDATGLQMAVVNEELDLNQGRTCSYMTDCSHSMLSCRFLRSINNETVIQVPYSNYDNAVEATKNGKLTGVIHFGKNFSSDLRAREMDGSDVANETIFGSLINVHLDRTNQHTALMLQRRFLEAFQQYSRDFQKSCSKEEAAASIPVEFLDPVYGIKEPLFTDFMAPGIILSVMYFMAVALTAATFITERKQGLFDRILVAGVQTSEILLAHAISQFMIIVGQTASVFIFTLFIYNMTCIGSIPLAVFISLLQGLCGMMFGFLISAICDEENSAVHLTLGSFCPDMLLSGITWPVEGMPVFMRYIAYCMPHTYAIESLRSIFARGWGIERPVVYMGILITCGWIAAFIILSLVILRIRKYTG